MNKFFILLTAATALFSCAKEKESVFKGAAKKVYEGRAWSSVKLGDNNVPIELTLTLDSNVLKSVAPGTGMPGHNHEDNIIVPLHEKAISFTPFKFIGLNWNPNGHEPAMIYDRPHFDMHFYMTTSTEVMNYTDSIKMENLPSAEYIPANHISGAPVPMMGKHWVDVTSPEFAGQGFTQTHIYGSYNGKVVFMEPMITLDFLKTTPSFERSIPQPAKFEKSGYYPTRLRISKHDMQTDIILDGFVYRQGS